MIKLPAAILFDLDETIISFGARQLILQAVAEEFPADFGAVSAQEAGRILEARFRAFWADEEWAHSARQRLAAARTEIIANAFAELRERAPSLTPGFAERFGARFHTYREDQAKFFPGAIETVEELKRRGVKLALVTNGAAEPQRAKVVRFDLARRFDHVQIEGEAGFGKPEEQAYLHAMQALGVSASETWMVGDNLEWEVVAPQRLGIYAIWHDHLGEGLPPGSPVRPDRIIRSIAELLEPVKD